jgi:hypothetical protein
VTTAGDLADPPGGDPELDSEVEEALIDQDIRSGKAERPPSYETRKQLAHQIEKGRRVTLWPPDGDDPITGYLAGWDPPGQPGGACNYFVVVPRESDVEQHLIPQEGTRLQLHTEVTYDDEKLVTQMERVIKGFRYYVTQQILGRGSASDRRSARKGGKSNTRLGQRRN